MQFTPNFHLDEFLVSETAERMGQAIVPTPRVVENLSRVAEVLQRIRDEMGQAISVTSGYRPIWLNNAIRGSTTSAHLFGLAADIKVDGVRPAEVISWIKARASRFPEIDQVILEFSWTHIGLSDDFTPPRNQFLVKRGGRYGRYV